MKSTRFSLVLAVTPILFSTHVMAEKGLAYDGAGGVWRTSYGECWTANYRDKEPADLSCFGERQAMAEGDADNDGVVDSRDQCPGTAAGVTVDGKGCALDSDGDGVIDADDDCPNTPRGVEVDSRGCELDKDSDGVVDSKDNCPNTPAGATVTPQGCAVQIVLENIRFELDSDQVSADYTATLDQVAASLKAREDIKSIAVIGHTDSTGSAAYNQRLSERRAAAVADYLAGKGIDSSLFTAKGMGEGSPVADNASAEGRARNRRVELKLD
ncbi:MAG: OmpA family protein [Candidatus Thiodiazotropha sp. (ex Dulcina madagascariensis)]|nr:OmpA family protein [Candidatus Thiodiazotropha sp. (ex Dulcina madagascariensis)]